MTTFNEIVYTTMKATGEKPMGAVFAIKRAIEAFELGVDTIPSQPIDWSRVRLDSDLIKNWIEGGDPDDAQAKMVRDAYAHGLRWWSPSVLKAAGGDLYERALMSGQP